MGPGRYVEIVGDIAILVLVLYDAFHAVVLPRRPLVHRLPLVGHLLFFPRRRAWRWVGSRRPGQEGREHILATFAPASALLMLAVLGFALVLGYGLVLDGLRDQIRPQPDGFWKSLYLSGRRCCR